MKKKMGGKRQVGTRRAKSEGGKSHPGESIAMIIGGSGDVHFHM